MPLQESAILALRTYQSQHEPFFLSLICCVQDSRSNVKMSQVFSIGILETTKKQKIFVCYPTCSGAPLLTLCIFPSASMYVRAVRLSVGLNGRK